MPNLLTLLLWIVGVVIGAVGLFSLGLIGYIGCIGTKRRRQLQACYEKDRWVSPAHGQVWGNIAETMLRNVRQVNDDGVFVLEVRCGTLEEGRGHHYTTEEWEALLHREKLHLIE